MISTKGDGQATRLGILLPDFGAQDWHAMNQLGFLVNKTDFYDNQDVLGEEQTMLRRCKYVDSC